MPFRDGHVDAVRLDNILMGMRLASHFEEAERMICRALACAYAAGYSAGKGDPSGSYAREFVNPYGDTGESEQ